MTSGHLVALLANLRRLASVRETAALSDGLLLERYVQCGDESAFAALVQRHGGMVWNVCRRVLDEDADADDAFQATFLVLLHKAATLRGRSSLAGWLQGVAWRLARRLKAEAARRRLKERRAETADKVDGMAEVEQRDLRALLDAELQRLPEKYRLPLVLCYLEGKTYAEAARQLDWKEGTVCGRLARAREMLRQRLSRRGLTLSGAALLASLTESSSVPAAVVSAVSRMAALFALGQAAGSGGVSASVATLAQGVLQAMTVAKLKTMAMLVAVMSVCAAGAGWTAHWVLADKPKATESKPAAQASKANAVPAVRKDYYGDPLPPGTLARMGSVQLRHEGARIAFASDDKTLISAGWDETVRFWSLATGRQIRERSFPKPKSPMIGGDDSILAGLSLDGKVVVVRVGESFHLCDTATGEKLWSYPAEGNGRNLPSFSADGKLLAALMGNGENYTIHLREVSTGKERLRLGKLKQTDNTLILSSDGSRLAYMAEGALHVCDTATGREVGKGVVEGWCFAFSPDGKLLATARNYNNDTTVTLWETDGLKKRATLRPSPRVTKRVIETPCLAFSPDGKSLAMGGLEELVLWDVVTGKEQRRLDDSRAKQIVFSSDGKTLACAGNFEIRLWNVATGERLHDRAGHDANVGVAVSPNGKTVASIAGRDPVVRLWDAATGKPLALSPKRDSWIRSIAFSAEGRLVVSGGFGVVRLLDASNGEEQQRFVVTDRKTGKQNQEILASHLSVDGKRLGVVSTDQKQTQLTLWNARTGERLACRPFRGDLDSCFTPNGAHVSINSRHGLALEDTLTGEERTVFPGDLGSPVAFSPDACLVAMGIHQTIDDGRPDVGPGYRLLGVRVVERVTREEIFRVEGWIEFAEFSPDGRLFVTVDTDSLRLWNVQTGELLLRREWPKDIPRRPRLTAINSLAFLPDGRSLVTGMNNGTLLVWDLLSEKWPKADTPRHLEGKELDALWADLAADARKSHRALYTLAASPKQTLPFLAEHLHPVAVVETKRVEKLLTDLDSDRFAVREAAAKELTDMGTQIEPMLRRVLESKPSLEVRNRVRAIQEALRGVPPTATLRTLRAIRVVDAIGTPEARKLLHKLAEGAAGARETREAKAALQRGTPR